MRLGRNLLLVLTLLLASRLALAADPPAGSAQPGAAPPAADKPEAGKTDAAKPSDDKPAADKPADDKPADDKPADDKPADDKTPGDKKPDDKKPADKPEPATADQPARTSSPAGDPKDDEYFELYQSLVDTLDQVERNYVRPVSRRELMEAAIEGVLSKLDPYSSYISHDEIGRFKSTVESQFGGIGVEIVPDHDPPQVSTPIVGTPAYRAGLQAGDLILEIDGTITKGMAHDDYLRRLRGEAGTDVKLLIQHAGSEKPETVMLTREVIHVDTVRGERRKSDDSWDFMLDPDQHIGYIRISSFSRDTEADLKKALQDLQSRGLKGLVLDLRFNPGGLLTSAIEVSDLFIAEGRIVGTTGRNTPQRVWDAVRPGTFEGFPIVILVNRYSASASEIVAACLQDHHRAVVVGERTWGKGSVQNVIEMENGKSALKLTIASYQRPSGKNIHRFPDAKETDEWGVHPDEGMEVRLSTDEPAGRDAEIRKMDELIRDRRQRDALVAHGKPSGGEKPAEANPAEGKPAGDKPFVDRQLQKAVDYLNQQIARAQ